MLLHLRLARRCGRWEISARREYTLRPASPDCVAARLQKARFVAQCMPPTARTKQGAGQNCLKLLRSGSGAEASPLWE